MKKTVFAIFLLSCAQFANAQSKVQCIRGADGKLQAALVWQNTLGVQRANMICFTSSIDSQPARSEQPPSVGQRFDSELYERAAGQPGKGATPRLKAEVQVPSSPHDIPAGFVQMWD